MKNYVRAIKGFGYTALAATFFSACNLIGGGGGIPTAESPGYASSATGLEFNEEGGFQVNDFQGQPDGPNLIFIEGGRTVLGSFEEDVFVNTSLL